MIAERWSCPLPGGGTSDEYAVRFPGDPDRQLLIVPALFAEGNRMRRLTVEIMRRLAGAGIGSILPDLPGTNESTLPLASQTASAWREAVAAAATQFKATHGLAVRGGCLFAPPIQPIWHYAPVRGAPLLRQMLRARIVASREAGREESTEALRAEALDAGITLSGYAIGAQFYRELEAMTPDADAAILDADAAPGSPLWLRAEPGEDPEQADAIAAFLAHRIIA